MIGKEGDPVRRRIFRPASEGHIDKAVFQGIGQRLVAALYQLDFYLRVLCLETFEDLREPVDGDAGKCPHPNRADRQPPDVRCELTQLFIPADDLPDGRDDPFAVLRGLHTGSAAGKERKSELFFQCLDHVADPGLGVAQLLAGFCDTAALDDLQEVLQPVTVHCDPAFPNKNYEALYCPPSKTFVLQRAPNL